MCEHKMLYFIRFDFLQKELMIWSTVSSQSCFCWLYRASLSLVAKNIINLILVLTICWCPCVKSFLCCWKRVFAMTSVFSWQNSVSLSPGSFCTPRPKLPVTPGISWLPTFAFQTPIGVVGRHPVHRRTWGLTEEELAGYPEDRRKAWAYTGWRKPVATR